MLFLLLLSAFHHKWSSASSRCTAFVRRVSLTVTPLISLLLLNTTSKTHTHIHTLWHTLFDTHSLSLTSFLLFLLQRQKCKGKQSFEEEMKKEKKKISSITSYLFLWKAENLAWSHFFSYNVSTSIISPLFLPLNTFNTVTCYNTAFFFGIELEKKSKYLVNRKQGYTQECRQMYLHKVLFTIRNKLQNQNNNQIFFFSQSKLQKSLFTLVHLSSTLV